MKFGLSTLLPKIFNERWVQFMSVVDSILDDLQTELVEPILYQYDIDNSTNQQIIDNIKYFGYTPSYLDGYSSTTEYLIREFITLSKRIKRRNNVESYELVLKIFFQKGTIYPLYYDIIDQQYIPYEDWWGIVESLKTIDTLDSDKDNLLYYSTNFFDDSSFFDSGVPFDYDIAIYGNPHRTNLPTGYLDTPELVETLDQFYKIKNITRYIYVSIICRKLLIDNYFFNFNAMTSLLYDLQNLHRPTEVLYFFPKVYLYTKNDKTETQIEIEKYDKSSITNINSIWIKDTLNDVQYIRYGIGYLNDVSTVYDLIEPTEEYTISQMYIKEKTDTVLSFFTQIIQNVKTFSFSEIGLYNIYNELIYYACFPSIIFPDNINGGNEIYIKLDTEENINIFYTNL